MCVEVCFVLCWNMKKMNIGINGLLPESKPYAMDDNWNETTKDGQYRFFNA